VNGAGKSTLCRILAGIESFDSGERIIGTNVTLSYFAQDQAEELDLTKDVLQTVEEVGRKETRTQLRTLLGSFLFHGDDVFKKVSILSGGEKSRLALAKMLLQPANFLIMDEPTNHLDMKSKRIVQEALANYDGMFMIVSHDRAFLDPLVTKVLEVQPGSIKTHLGNISEYIQKKRVEKNVLQPFERIKDVEIKKYSTRSMWQEEKLRKRVKEKELRTIKRELVTIEAEIAKYEHRKHEIELLLADPELYKNGLEVKNLRAEYQDILSKIDSAYQRWTAIINDLEKESE
jgi:ATP-binding cassette subfamily F protein 3